MRLLTFFILSLSLLVFACDFAPADTNPSSNNSTVGNITRERIDRNVLDVEMLPPEEEQIRIESIVTFGLQYHAMRNAVVKRELDSNGDGKFDREFDGPGIRVSTFYKAPGQYEPVIKVTDEKDYISTYSCRITVVD